MINASMEILNDEEGSANPMVQYRDMDIILSLKAGAKLSMYKGLAVYCNKYHVSQMQLKAVPWYVHLDSSINEKILINGSSNNLTCNVNQNVIINQAYDLQLNFGNADFPTKMRLPRGPRRRTIRPRSLGQLLNNQGTHNVSGTLFHVDEKTLLISRFVYDGMSPGKPN